MSTLIPVGQIVNVHGIKGAVKIKPYLNEPTLMASFGPMTDKTGEKVFEIFESRIHGDVIIAFLKGIADRNTAETLKGTTLYVHKDMLPAGDEDEFYYHDLIGMDVVSNGVLYGKVKSVENYGAGDILEIEKTNGKVMSFAFTDENFPKVDVSAKTIDFIEPGDINGDTDED